MPGGRWPCLELPPQNFLHGCHLSCSRPVKWHSLWPPCVSLRSGNSISLPDMVSRETKRHARAQSFPKKTEANLNNILLFTFQGRLKIHVLYFLGCLQYRCHAGTVTSVVEEWNNRVLLMIQLRSDFQDRHKKNHLECLIRSVSFKL